MKKLSIVLLMNVLLPVMVFAQISFSSASQQMIELAVQNGVGLLRQEYQLEDSTTLKRYTMNNNPEFGSAVSFCVMTEKGYVVSERILKPWVNDPKFEKYEGTQYRPILSKTYLKTLKNGEFKDVELMNQSEQCTLAFDEWIMVKDSLFNNQGFVIDTLSGKKDGWLVWLTNSEDNVDYGTLSITTYRYELTLEADKAVYEISSPSFNQNIVGGIYIEPQYPGVGRIEFAIVGIVVKVDDGWRMIRCADTSHKGWISGSNEDSDLTLSPA